MSNTLTLRMKPTQDQVNGERIFAHSPSVDAADGTIVMWPLHTTRTFVDTAARLYLTSDEEADTGITYAIRWIDDDGVEHDDLATTHAVDARTPVDTGFDSKFVQQVVVVTNDTPAAGNIYVARTNTSPLGIPTDKTKIEAYVEAGVGVSQQAAYYCPSNWAGGIKYLGGKVTVGGTGISGIAVRLHYRNPDGPDVVFENVSVGTDSPYDSLDQPFALVAEPNTILWATVDTNTANNVDIHGTFFIEKLR